MSIFKVALIVTVLSLMTSLIQSFVVDKDRQACKSAGGVYSFQIGLCFKPESIMEINEK